MAPRNPTRRAAEPQHVRRKHAAPAPPSRTRTRRRWEATTWEWIYNVEEPAHDDDGDDGGGEGDRKRRKVSGSKIVGARMGSLQCRVGDCVLLKADGSNDAWVAIICEFIDGDADGAWLPTLCGSRPRSEIRQGQEAQRFLLERLYISPSWDATPCFHQRRLRSCHSRPFSGKVARHLPDFGRTFICRRGCNTRTATYTDEFVWEDIYRGGDDVFDH
ncbi:origin recognition complex subunit 1 [Hirsutella rhossiliensis]|uniref:Origin recognition complex subunit 1 n=1 Tax=Hirsutella rhossiliensis TaxID=111463 RepID=A0A9P8SDR2_9HYPO|nr:origin recognition complex subunit 1 [Hirsutella rhossiliensis]KAH0957276.1 origin recognition complex subunit 1 [Hirsutella rhossiliensis]